MPFILCIQHTGPHASDLSNLIDLIMFISIHFARWENVPVFPACLAFWIDTVCLSQGQSVCGSVFHCSLTPPSSISRCIGEPVVPAGDHLWSGSLQRLPLCLMEVMLGATEWPLPPRCPQGGALPGRRPTTRPHRGKEESFTFNLHILSESIHMLSNV